MTMPFDVPSLDDEEEGQVPADPSEFDVPELGDDPVAEAAPAEPSWADYLIAFGDGASLGHGDVSQDVGNWAADLLGQGAPKDATRVGGGVMEQLPDTTGTRAAKTAGGVAAGLTASALAGPGVAAQAAMGAVTGAASAHGEGESMLGGATAGGALGLTGVLAAKGLTSAAKGGADEAMEALLQRVKPRAEMAMRPWELPGSLAATGAIKGAQKLAPYSAVTAPAARGYSQSVAERSGSAGDEVSAVSPISWAAQSVLSSGKSGLPPQEERAMTEAVLSGDKEKLAAADFAAAMKYPAYESGRRDKLQTLQRKE